MQLLLHQIKDKKKWISLVTIKKKKGKEILFVALSHLILVQKKLKKMKTFQIHFHCSLIHNYIFLSQNKRDGKV